MKMSLKLSILFSALAVAIAIAFSVITYQSNLRNLYNNTFTSLNAMGKMMQTEIEEYIRLMNYSIEELTSNSDFISAFDTVSRYEGPGFPPTIEKAQETMTAIMSQEPLQNAFSRVCAYSKNGFFLNSRFDEPDAISSFSDASREIIASLDYLNELDSNPDRQLILGARMDPWGGENTDIVFSLIKAIMHDGNLIGYVEVSAPMDDLANIFLTLEQEGLFTQAVFDDGSTLFRMMGEDFDYTEIPVGKMTTYPMEEASDRWVVKQYSSPLYLSIYVSQEIDALGSTRSTILLQSVMVMLPILIIAILLVILFSYRLTGSIRKLNSKIRDLPAESFLSQPDTVGSFFVVNPSDKELYQMEESFNNMLTRLRSSHANEVALREGTLTARLNALQLQINPHFVYNTLNIISAKGLESGNLEITELCDQFAQMLRYSTDVRAQTATLKDELDNVRQYLSLCKSRYEDQLEYEIDVPSNLMNILVPKLTLQPIVENAMKYGRRGAGIPCQIHIEGTADNTHLSLKISDNGDGFDWDTLNQLRKNFRLIEKNEQPEEPAMQEHLGLINTYRRLYYYSHGAIHLDIYNQNGAVVEITQKLPDKGSKEEVKDNV